MTGLDLTAEQADWLADWLASDMRGDAAARAAFAAALAGDGPTPVRRIGNLYAASLSEKGLLLENIHDDDLAPVLIPAPAARRALLGEG
ncbi:hypothetical protein [Niveispirillum sp. BGYR6]|uniref:hypothetical protein n=1 Tax=Niveispirillum sp. BGYR6 TaxID=2971249 RepID=UPI0022B9553C|nr:hypothetical protein [Niveispirillum sp. BGYR6]MDG5494707.1 hypothetical protein [Niveispirillum sp. BGYR6]